MDPQMPQCLLQFLEHPAPAAVFFSAMKKWYCTRKIQRKGKGRSHVSLR
jgi:hypothetical protein